MLKLRQHQQKSRKIPETDEGEPAEMRKLRS